MPDASYFQQPGEPSEASGHWVSLDELDPIIPQAGLEFRPVSTDSVMTNFVTFEPNAPAPMHHHDEQQIVIVLSGEMTFTAGEETREMKTGDVLVIPPNVPHGAVGGPDGCHVLDVFTPPRAAIVGLMEAAG
jgi:quercetin dioxygenase-like cupin family protein